MSSPGRIIIRDLSSENLVILRHLPQKISKPHFYAMMPPKKTLFPGILPLLSTLVLQTYVSYWTYASFRLRSVPRRMPLPGHRPLLGLLLKLKPLPGLIPLFRLRPLPRHMHLYGFLPLPGLIPIPRLRPLPIVLTEFVDVFFHNMWDR